MNEKMKKEENPESGLSFITKVEDAVNFVRKNGFLEMPKADREALEIDESVFEKEGLKTNGDVIYDPKKFESQTVDTYKGLDPKYKEEGWEEVGQRSAGGYLGTLIKKIEQKPEEQK